MELNKKVIIRADRAGVFYGTIIRKDKDEVELKIAEEFGIGMVLPVFRN